MKFANHQLLLKRSLYLASFIILYTNLFAQAPFGSALHLNGDQQYFEIPDAPYLNLDATRDFTLELRFKTNGSTPYNLVNKMFVDLDHKSSFWPRFSWLVGWYKWQETSYR